jgi:hypothetical protein
MTEMGRKKRGAFKRLEALRELVVDQRADQQRDKALTRPRRPEQKTTRLRDDLGRRPEDT